MYWPFVKSEVSLSTSSSHTSARINLPQLKDSMSGKSGSTSAANHHVLLPCQIAQVSTIACAAANNLRT